MIGDMGDPDLMTEHAWRSFIAEGAKRVRRIIGGPPPEPLITDEELLAILFEDSIYGPILKKITIAKDGWAVAHIIRRARAELGHLITCPNSRSMWGLPPIPKSNEPKNK